MGIKTFSASFKSTSGNGVGKSDSTYYCWIKGNVEVEVTSGSIKVTTQITDLAARCDVDWSFSSNLYYSISNSTGTIDTAGSFSSAQSGYYIKKGSSSDKYAPKNFNETTLTNYGQIIGSGITINNFNPSDTKLQLYVKVGNNSVWSKSLGKYKSVYAQTTINLYDLIDKQDLRPTVILDNVSYNVNEQTISWTSREAEGSTTVRFWRYYINPSSQIEYTNNPKGNKKTIPLSPRGSYNFHVVGLLTSSVIPGTYNDVSRIILNQPVSIQFVFRQSEGIGELSIIPPRTATLDYYNTTVTVKQGSKKLTVEHTGNGIYKISELDSTNTDEHRIQVTVKSVISNGSSKTIELTEQEFSYTVVSYDLELKAISKNSITIYSGTGQYMNLIDTATNQSNEVYIRPEEYTYKDTDPGWNFKTGHTYNLVDSDEKIKLAFTVPTNIYINGVVRDADDLKKTVLVPYVYDNGSWKITETYYYDSDNGWKNLFQEGVSNESS